MIESRKFGFKNNYKFDIILALLNDLQTNI